ncbi:MAG: fibronectin type III domain-containing protein, partial [Nocardiopsaceae bacterium]|nr:fibronectin type III domain-containing protein [Nocardiopsaceae bacterium]
GAPGAPSTTSGPGYIDVSFTPSSGGTPSGYELEVGGSAPGSAPPGMSVQPARMPADGSFTFHVTGGSCGTQYTFRVAARYRGSRIMSPRSGPARPCVAPASPAGFTAAGVNHGANLSWSAPAGGGAPPAYTVSYSGATSGTAPASGTSAQVTGLTNGGQYGFTLTAANAAGSAQATATASLVPPPQGFSAFDDQSNQVRVRSAPSTSASQVGTIPQGSGMALTVNCQVLAESVTDQYQTWKTSQVWDQVQWNGGTAYVSDLYVNTPHSAGQGSSAPDPYPPADYSYPPVWQCS